MYFRKNIVLLFVCTLLLGGCATTANRDPLEGINRGVYKFNEATDRVLLKPIAKGYQAVTPKVIRTGVSNFFNNLRLLTTVVNDLLQLKISYFLRDGSKFIVNSTVGLLGVVDVASKKDSVQHYRDFGQTLAVWGISSGTYLVLPIIGSSSGRDVIGLTFDTITSDPINWLRNGNHVAASTQLRAAQIIDKRTELLSTTKVINDIALDPYVLNRETYLQYRDGLTSTKKSQVQQLERQYELDDEDMTLKTSPAEPPSSAKHS